MKKVALVSLLAIFMVFSGNLTAQETSKIQKPALAASDISIKSLTPETFQDFATGHVGNEVEIKGMVIHVCKHGGKKMFIIGEDPEQRVKITANDIVTEFKPELEGSMVYVRGIIEPIEEEAVPEEEKHDEDADHKNYYHKPQYAISCMKFETIE